MTRALLSLVLVTTLVTGCDSTESLRVEETRAKLVGTWLRETERDGTKAQRMVTLGGDGKFTDRIVRTASDGTSERRDYAGEWSYDGTNLKRRYLLENGRQFSGGSMRYTTFPLVSIASSELVVNDNIEGQQVTYRRIADGTKP